MFITEAQLALYKYQVESKYFGKTMADIFSAELLEYSRNNNFYVIECISWFLNKKISSNVWKVYFSDESVALIRIADLDKTDNSREIEMQTFNFDVNSDFVFAS